MKHSILLQIFLILAIYFGLKYFGGHYGRIILYPITLLVTFLHEFGHALGALVTGGSVDALQINDDGSGFTVTRGGSKPVILMGGYIGSAILGNLLFYIGVRLRRFAQFTLSLLAFVMALAAVVWFNSLYTTGLLFLFAFILYYLANKTAFDGQVLMFLGLISILYIIQDFNVGPQSDLQHYADTFHLIPAQAWMYVWLVIVVLLFAFNIRMIFRQERAQQRKQPA